MVYVDSKYVKLINNYVYLIGEDGEGFGMSLENGDPSKDTPMPRTSSIKQDKYEWKTHLPSVLLTLPDDVMELQINGEPYSFGTYGGKQVLASVELKMGLNQFELRMIRTGGNETTRTIMITRHCDYHDSEYVERSSYVVDYHYENYKKVAPMQIQHDNVAACLVGDWGSSVGGREFFVPAPVIPLDNVGQETIPLRVLLKLRQGGEMDGFGINREYYTTKYSDIEDWTEVLKPLDLKIGLNQFELETIGHSFGSSLHSTVMITRLGDAPEDVEIGGYWLRYYEDGNWMKMNVVAEYIYDEGLPFLDIPEMPLPHSGFTNWMKPSSMMDLEKRLEFFVPAQDGDWLHYYYDESNNLVREYITADNLSLPSEAARSYILGIIDEALLEATKDTPDYTDQYGGVHFQNSISLQAVRDAIETAAMFHLNQTDMGSYLDSYR